MFHVEARFWNSNSWSYLLPIHVPKASFGTDDDGAFGTQRTRQFLCFSGANRACQREVASFSLLQFRIGGRGRRLRGSLRRKTCLGTSGAAPALLIPRGRRGSVPLQRGVRPRLATFVAMRGRSRHARSTSQLRLAVISVRIGRGAVGIFGCYTEASRGILALPRHREVARTPLRREWGVASSPRRLAYWRGHSRVIKITLKKKSVPKKRDFSSLLKVHRKVFS